jgi:hypothetical protein
MSQPTNIKGEAANGRHFAIHKINDLASPLAYNAFQLDDFQNEHFPGLSIKLSLLPIGDRSVWNLSIF